MNAKTLTLVKGGHKYIFRYPQGSENEIVDSIIELAEDAQTNLDWLDAATLSFQVAQGAAVDCHTTMIPAPAPPAQE
jgi:hypothetical protein